MHDIGRTQLEQQSFGEFEGQQFAGGELESANSRNWKANSASHGRRTGGRRIRRVRRVLRAPVSRGPLSWRARSARCRRWNSPPNCSRSRASMTWSSSLATCSGRPARPSGTFVRSDTGRALGGILRDSLRSVAKQALPVVGRAIGDTAGDTAIGDRAGSAVGNLLGLELEGLSAEDREFEVARQLVRFAGSAVGQAAVAPPRCRRRSSPGRRPAARPGFMRRDCFPGCKGGPRSRGREEDGGSGGVGRSCFTGLES